MLRKNMTNEIKKNGMKNIHIKEFTKKGRLNIAILVTFFIKEVVTKVKFNIYNQRNKFDKENSENNKLNWKEVYENNLNVDDDTKRALDVLDTDTAKQQYLKITPAKLEVELWKYKFNPVFKDTDFDGIDDGFGYKRDTRFKMDRDELKSQIDDLMQQYDKEEIDGKTYLKNMIEIKGTVFHLF